MTLEQARDLIQQELRQFGGEMSKALVSPLMIARYLNMGANLIAQETHCLQQMKHFTCTVGADYYNIDSMIEITGVVYDNLPLSRLDDALRGKVWTTSGTPTMYSIEEPDHMRLWPPPSEEKVVYYTGYRWPTAVSSDGDSIDLPVGLADLCVDYALYRATAIVQPENQEVKYTVWRNQLNLYIGAAKNKSFDPNQPPEDVFFGGTGMGKLGLDM